jgi:hypothetical protein
VRGDFLDTKSLSPCAAFDSRFGFDYVGAEIEIEEHAIVSHFGYAPRIARERNSDCWQLCFVDLVTPAG